MSGIYPHTYWVLTVKGERPYQCETRPYRDAVLAELKKGRKPITVQEYLVKESGAKPKRRRTWTENAR